jgi:hypothetical protein
LLLPKNGSDVATIEKVRSLAVLYETRGKNRANDMAKMLKTLGLEVPNDPKNPRRKPNANTRWAAGKGGDGKGKGGKGRDGKGKGKDGKGKGGKGRNRNRWRSSTSEEDVPIDKDDCVAGLDGEINAHVKCHGCHLWGHIDRRRNSE